jgi:plasmid maintenance system killer protein
MLDVRNIKSTALRQFARGEGSRINPDWQPLLNCVLFMLDAAVHPSELAVLGEAFCRLPKREDTYSVKIAEGVYVTFQWSDEGHPVTVDLGNLE